MLHLPGNDTALINEFKRTGDLKVLGELYSPYIPLVLGVCMKYLKHRERAEDAVMEIFEALVERIPKYEIENFKPWLHVLTRNHCLMILRSAEWKNLQSVENISEISMEMPSLVHHDNGMSMSEVDVRHLKACIENLQDAQKRCVALFYLEERSYKEIAEETEFELKKVKSYIQNGKRNLKNCIEKKRENS